MQAQAAEFSGYAGKFRCFLERRAQTGKPSSHSATPELLQLLTSSLAPLFKSYLARKNVWMRTACEAGRLVPLFLIQHFPTWSDQLDVQRHPANGVS